MTTYEGAEQMEAINAYYLPKHVHVCASENCAIFLDLRRDEYVGIDREQMHALTPLVRGWLNSNSNIPSSTSLKNGAKVARALTARGILTDQSNAGKEVLFPVLDCVEEELPSIESTKPISLSYLTNLIGSHIKVRSALRFRRLDQIAAGMMAKVSSDTVNPQNASLERTRFLITAFRKMRPLVYTHRDRCLLDTLTLVTFLRKYSISANWVIGVRPTPFLAHSWAQMGRYALNVSPEYVRRFSPIACFQPV